MARKRILPKPTSGTVAPRPATDKQEKFATVYFETMDRMEALRQAGYQVENEQSAAVMACRLLKTPNVMILIDKLRTAAINKAGITGAGVVQRLLCVYVAAMQDKDYSAAVSALDKLGKHFGIYLEHNKQKGYSPEDIDRLKAELQQAGFNFERLQFPSTN